MQPFETPIACIIFNRPDKAARVFAEIRKVRPKQLFIIADGPRTEDERTLTEETRAVVETIDWDCEVHRNYSDTNLGCRIRPPTGISWVFEHVEKAIILEDDCVPHQSFFSYCAELLEYYKDDERVMHIGGANLQAHLNPLYACSDSYYFSISPNPWGWATWRRAWSYYDLTMSLWPEVEHGGLLGNVFAVEAVRDKWERLFKLYYAGKINSWDGLWAFACFTQRGLAIVPKENLITNIGFAEDATHGTSAGSPGAGLPSYPMRIPLQHPHVILPNVQHDAYTFTYEHTIGRDRITRILWFYKSRFPVVYGYLRALWHRAHSNNTN